MANYIYNYTITVVIFLCLEVSVCGDTSKCAKFFVDSKGWNYGICQPILGKHEISSASVSFGIGQDD